MLLQDLSIPDEATACTFEECKKIFIVVNFEADKTTTQADINEDKALMRYEFLEALVRMAHARFKGDIDDVSECVDALLERVVLPNAPPAGVLEPDVASGVLSLKRVDEVVGLPQRAALL